MCLGSEPSWHVVPSDYGGKTEEYIRSNPGTMNPVRVRPGGSDFRQLNLQEETIVLGVRHATMHKVLLTPRALRRVPQGLHEQWAQHRAHEAPAAGAVLRCAGHQAPAVAPDAGADTYTVCAVMCTAFALLVCILSLSFKHIPAGVCSHRALVPARVEVGRGIPPPRTQPAASHCHYPGSSSPRVCRHHWHPAPTPSCLTTCLPVVPAAAVQPFGGARSCRGCPQCCRGRGGS